jgi:hypothetical protein
VYRDPWERKPFSQEELNFEDRGPQDEIDYLEIRDMVKAINAIYEKDVARSGRQE